MNSKLEVSIWDEISGEIGKTHIDLLPPEATPKDVIEAAYRSIDYTPDPEETWTSATLGFLGVTAIYGNDGQGRQFVMWWGPKSEAFGYFVLNAVA